MQMSNIKMMYILLSSFAVTLCTVTDAWMTKYDFKGNFGGDKWQQPCVKTDEECEHTSQCCKRQDVCVLDSTRSFLEERRVGICANMNFLRNEGLPTKFEGENCKDSSECMDGCCVTVRRLRSGPMQVCAIENGGFMCI